MSYATACIAGLRRTCHNESAVHHVDAVIRDERPSDISGVRIAHQKAFRRDAEATLVDRLREEARIVSSVVAEIGNEIVGNAIFSRISVSTSDGRIDALALAPVAVLPQYQRQGVGSRIIQHGVRASARHGYAAIFVLGDPSYYSRFGFSSDIARRVSSPYSKAGAAWMALEIKPASLSDGHAHATYPEAFSIVE